MKSLLRPLFKKWIKFYSVNFSNKMNEETYQRVVNEFEKIWAESLRELN
jgi:hypothetical protein